MFYLYALPVGTLGAQIETFRATYAKTFGVNKAHEYPVHVTLTHKFPLEAERVGECQQLLSKHFAQVSPFRVGGLKHIPGKELVVLELENDAIAEATRNWALEIARPDVHVVDARFHVTIAWKTRWHGRIFELAQEVIHRSMDVEWKIALCESPADSTGWRFFDGAVLR